MEETATILELPDLYVCEVKDGRLTIPGETRSRWMACPVRAPEWRTILQKFDLQWAAPLEGSSSPTCGESAPVVAATVDENGGEEEVAGGFWEGIFPDEPTTKAALETKYGAGSHKFTLNANEHVIAVILEGPMLFLVASADTTLSANEPILCFGAGTWLLDSKADAWMQDGPYELSSCKIRQIHW